MTTSVSYCMSCKYTKEVAVGAASDAEPLIIINNIPIHYSIDSWGTGSVDITKCSIGVYDGTTYTKLLALTADEAYMKYDFVGLLTSATKSDAIQQFFNANIKTLAIAYVADTAGVATSPANILVHVGMSAFKYI